MLPLLVAGLGAAYGAGKLFDTTRYWAAYYRNTGHTPRYPFLGSAGAGVKASQSVFQNLKRL